jgi:hypothetical protein
MNTDISTLNAGEKQALMDAKLGDIRKKVNADSWSVNMENLMKKWGEKAAGLRFMHANSAGIWKNFSNKLSIAGIVITGFASTISLIATGIEDEDVKNGFMFSVGGIGLFSTLIQSFKKFYNAEEKAAEHANVSKQFGSFYRYMTLQLSMGREDRDPADVLTDWALKEYERLQGDAPPLDGISIQLFKDKFKNSLQAIPDIAEDEFIINIFNNKQKTLENNVENTIKISNVTIVENENVENIVK